MDHRLSDGRVSCRPHIKVHRVPELARMQVAVGAAGIACQTLDDVETMVTAGFRETLLTNSIVDRKKLNRLSELMGQASLALTADSVRAVGELAEVAAASGQNASVCVGFVWSSGRP